MLFTVIFGVFLTALPVHLDEKFGLSAGPRGLILSTFAIGATIASFNLGRMRARWSARTMLVGASVVIAVTAAGLGLAPTVALVVVASIAYGLGDGTAIPAMQDLVTAAAPDEQRASVMAAWVSGIRLGQTIGPLGRRGVVRRHLHPDDDAHRCSHVRRGRGCRHDGGTRCRPTATHASVTTATES